MVPGEHHYVITILATKGGRQNDMYILLFLSFRSKVYKISRWWLGPYWKFTKFLQASAMGFINVCRWFHCPIWLFDCFEKSLRIYWRGKSRTNNQFKLQMWLFGKFFNNFIEIQNIRFVKIVVWLKTDLSVSSKCNVDVILIFVEDFVDLWLIEIPSWSIIDSHDFIVFMKFHPSSTTEWNIFHCWKVVSIFIHLESVLRQWSFCNSVCIGLKLNDFLLAGMSRFSPSW